MPAIHRVSFSLEPEYRDILSEMAWRNRRSMTQQMRVLIIEAAQAMDIDTAAVTAPEVDAKTRPGLGA